MTPHAAMRRSRRARRVATRCARCASPTLRLESSLHEIDRLARVGSGFALWPHENRLTSPYRQMRAVYAARVPSDHRLNRPRTAATARNNALLLRAHVV